MSGRVQSKLEVQKKQVETEIVIQRKHWNEYSAHELRAYMLKNLEKADCSFVIVNQDDKKARKVYESFKWILCDMSPVLKQILDDPINQAKNWKEIVVSNPNNIKAVLFYGHFKVVDKEIIDLVDSYEASKQYQIPSLKDEVIKMCILEGIPENANWVRLFWMTHIKYPEDQRSMSAVFKNVKGEVEHHDQVVEANIDLILRFNEVYFDIFFDIMLSHFKNNPKMTAAFIMAGLTVAVIGYMGRQIISQYPGNSSRLQQIAKHLTKVNSMKLAKSNYYDGGFNQTMTKREAALILGVSPNAPKSKIKDAHKRIMLLNHPDRGGSPYIASKINEAKDILDKK